MTKRSERSLVSPLLAFEGLIEEGTPVVRLRCETRPVKIILAGRMFMRGERFPGWHRIVDLSTGVSLAFALLEETFGRRTAHAYEAKFLAVVRRLGPTWHLTSDAIAQWHESQADAAADAARRAAQAEQVKVLIAS